MYCATLVTEISKVLMTLCSLERLVSHSFPSDPEFHVRQAYACALGIYVATSGAVQCTLVDE